MQRSCSTDLVFANYRIQSDEHILYFRGFPVPLAPKVLATLAVFMAEPGRVIPKAELMKRIWPDGFVEDANLTQNIYVLRKLFDQHGTGLRIENVPKRGYRLVEPPPALPPRSLKAVPAGESSSRLSQRETWRGAFAVVAALAAFAAAAAFLPRPHGPRDPYELPASAMQQYLLGRHELQQGMRPALLRSTAYFATVINDVPNSALGYAGLSESNTSLSFFARDETERARNTAQAIALAKQAIAVDASSAEAYAALGAVKASIEHDTPAATRAFQTALRIDPHNLDALSWYGTALLNDGRALEARTL
ncbi:MAG: winged helix-turn-helix domain-containing protein, partial [Candidatus Eremiobacteraeota bacterium]|nr:winged helix-turn-helix domain-containing protein [Candidatus Eremiobacteraeota bacterium]